MAIAAVAPFGESVASFELVVGIGAEGDCGAEVIAADCVSETGPEVLFAVVEVGAAVRFGRCRPVRVPPEEVVVEAAAAWPGTSDCELAEAGD